MADQLSKRIADLAKVMGKKAPTEKDYISYDKMKQQYERQANEDVRKLQQETKLQRVDNIYGRSDLNPKWTFDNLIQDSDDVIEAVSIAQSFIAAHEDPAWRQSGSHMMIFYGDYGRGKSHIAGAMAHQLIQQYEISVLYRQLSSLLEMRFFSYDYNSDDKISQKYRETYEELLDVELLILDEVCVNETVLKKSAQSWLGTLLRQRLIDKKNCIIITNHNLRSLEAALGPYCFESIKEYDTYKVRFSGHSRRQEVVPVYQEESTAAPRYQPNQVK